MCVFGCGGRIRNVYISVDRSTACSLVSTLLSHDYTPIHPKHTHTHNTPQTPIPHSRVSFPASGIDADVLRALQGLALVAAAGAGYAMLWALLLLAAPARLTRYIYLYIYLYIYIYIYI